MTCSSRCDSTGGDSSSAGTAGRVNQDPPRNYWPDHDQAPVTNFVSARNRVALMWKL